MITPVPVTAFEYAVDTTQIMKSMKEAAEEELVKLTLAIVAINGANRINVAFRAVPGSYQPAARREAE